MEVPANKTCEKPKFPIPCPEVYTIYGLSYRRLLSRWPLWRLSRYWYSASASSGNMSFFYCSSCKQHPEICMHWPNGLQLHICSIVSRFASVAAVVAVVGEVCPQFLSICSFALSVVAAVAVAVLPVRLFPELVLAPGLSLMTGRAPLASVRRCNRPSAIPQTIRSRNMSSSVSPKSQCSDNRLRSETKLAIGSPGFCLRDPNLNRCKITEGFGW